MGNMFQFPTNGKAYPKEVEYDVRRDEIVSIPYEREGISKGTLFIPKESRETLSFNSLRTGRHIQREVWIGQNKETAKVSIPYEREGISKGGGSDSDGMATAGFNSLRTGRHIQSEPRRHQPIRARCFNSLRTGRHIQRKKIGGIPSDENREFQFPTNGKAYPKTPPTARLPSETIMFQFPTNGKAYPKTARIIILPTIYLFQFPTNGKAYPKGR